MIIRKLVIGAMGIAAILTASCVGSLLGLLLTRP